MPTELPKSEESEKSLLAAALCDPRVLDTVESIVTRLDFFDDVLGKTFGLLQTLRAAGQPFDPGLVIDALRRSELLLALGGGQAVAELFQRTWESGNAVYYAREIAKSSALRRQIMIGEQMIRMAHVRNADPADVRSWAETQLERTGSVDGLEVRTARDVAVEFVEELIADSKEGRKPGVMTGFWSLDNAIGSLQKGELVIVGARPSVGKTAFALQIADHVAMRAKRSLVVSLEMRDRELIARLLAKHSGINGRAIRSRVLGSDDHQKLAATAESMESMALSVWAPASAKMAQIRAISRLEHAKEKLELLVVDYLQMIDQDSQAIDRKVHVGRCSRALKALAKELDIPVLVACQLNREAEGQRPTLGNLRDSGEIEQDADVVMLLHRETRDAVETILDVAKHRNNETGAMVLHYDGGSTSFSDPNEPKPVKSFADWNQRKDMF